jgi:hypothetical protein
VDGVDVVVLGFELTPLGAVASPVVVLLHAVRSTAADTTTKALGPTFTGPATDGPRQPKRKSRSAPV